jgi:crotonobetainyl-CoA:carnitine CoA-transferase CaiB-like acyl-CoA transferase
MRVKERSWLIPRINEITKKHSVDALAAKLEAIGMPFAPIAKPWDLLNDPHLKASGGLLETHYCGKRSHIPALPIALDGKRLVKRSDPPVVGEHGAALLSELGYSQSEIAGLAERRIVAFPTNGGGDQ